ncbi:hypothetical protein [Pseudofulvibacter geojedonensis]|uniref:Lipoprotein n=1 Tax=Pseudofulvibacter geojedonensis TaxID=1123758 RepID=A0ABW3I4Z9_9FLAO
MKKLLKLSAFVVLSLFMFQSCSEDESKDAISNYSVFEAEEAELGIIVGETSGTRTVTVLNSSVASSDRVFNIIVDTDATTADPANYDVASSVTIPAGESTGTFEVTSTNANLGLELHLKIEPQEGWFIGKDIKLNIVDICADGTEKVTVDIVFDGYATESDWNITDSNGTVVMEVTGYATNVETDIQSACLAHGDYTFTINDSYGDGLSYPENGEYKVLVNGNQVVIGGGNFGSSASHNFTVGN